MIQKLRIEGRLPSMNDVIKANRSNKFAGNTLKQKATNEVALAAKQQKLKSFTKKINLEFIWHCKDRRRDKDNIMSAQKFILDGLQKADVIKNDGWKEIGEIKHQFEIDKNEGVVVYMAEVENE